MNPQIPYASRFERRTRVRHVVCGNGWGRAVLLVGLSLVIGCGKPHPDPNSALRTARTPTLSSFDLPRAGEKVLPAGTIKFDQANLSQVLGVYAEVSGRSIILGANLPEAKITFSNQTPMGAVEVLQALDTVLAAQGFTVVVLGSQYVKVVSAKDASAEPGPIVELRPDQLPDSSSFLIYFVKKKNITPSQALPALSPFAKLPNSILAIPPPNSNSNAKSSKGALPSLPISFGSEDTIFVFRDYSANVRRMLKVLDELEQQ